jgi:hypothetical protein
MVLNSVNHQSQENLVALVAFTTLYEIPTFYIVKNKTSWILFKSIFSWQNRFNIKVSC